jgi:hypothetical protein
MITSEQTPKRGTQIMSNAAKAAFADSLRRLSVRELVRLRSVSVLQRQSLIERELGCR